MFGGWFGGHFRKSQMINMSTSHVNQHSAFIVDEASNYNQTISTFFTIHHYSAYHRWYYWTILLHHVSCQQLTMIINGQICTVIMK
jgi:hypothetical protein